MSEYQTHGCAAAKGRACRSATAVPPLRFKGYDGAWRNKNIGEVVSFSKGKGYSKSNVRESGVPLFLYGRMYTNYEAEVSAVDTYCEPFACSVYSSGKEVVCPASGETAEDIARASAVVSRGIVLGGDLNILTPNDDADIDSLFLALSMSNGNTGKNIASRAQGKTVVHVHNSDYDEIPLSLPTIPEQRKIGTSFRQIDALIAAREKALGKLTDLKKAMLEKMFPQAGAKEPEVRFKGFEGEWEERRLGDTFGMSVSTNTLSRSCLSDHGTVKNVHYGDVLIKLPCVTDAQTSGLPFVTDEKFRTSAKNLLRDGDVVMADTAEDSTAGKVTEVRGIGNQQVVSGLHTIVLRPNESFGEGFLGYCLNSESFHTGLQSIMQGVKVLSVNKSALVDCTLVVPSFSEQQKIGAYFRSLDLLISARREEVGKLKDLKKALLDRMFV